MPWPAFNNPATFTAGRLNISGHVHGWPLAVKILYGYGRSVLTL